MIDQVATTTEVTGDIAARIDAALTRHMPRAGGYAFDVAYGRANLSGSDLSSKQRAYAKGYAVTRGKVLAALVAEHVAVETVGAHGKRALAYFAA